MRRPLFMICLCLVTIAALRLWVYHSSDTGGERTTSPPVEGEYVTVTGRVSQKDTQSFTIDAVVFLAGTQVAKQSENSSYAADLRQNIPFEEKLICEYSGADSVMLGSTVTLRGTFCAFSEATNPGEFDVAGYYHTLQIGGKLTDITILEESSEYSEWREMLQRLRNYFRTRLYRVFPQKEASVLTAMLLGDKEGLDAEIKELYQQNGIIHILSISGLHITMIGMSVYRLLRRCGVPVWPAALCGGVILCLYGVMTGMSVSAARAIGMYLIRMLGELVGRTYDMLTALGILAAVLVWQNPENLNNAGFLLSFGSILGIGWLYPAILPQENKSVRRHYEPQKWKRVLRDKYQKWWNGLVQSILASMSITLFTLPIQLWFYYEVPVYSILINLLVLPFMSMLMITGLTAMLLPGTGIVGTVTCLVLQVYEWLCHCFDRLPYHTWNPGRPEIWQVVVYYLLLLVVVALQERRKRGAIGKKHDRVKLTVLPYAILTIAVIVLVFRINTITTVTFLDIGQGDCILMETASGEVFLFDCGSTSRKQVGEYVLLPFLKYNGIHHIDAVFVSHPDEDHCSGIEELFGFAEEEGITVGQLVLPDIAEAMREEEFDFLWQAVRGEVDEVNAGTGDAGQDSETLVSYISAGDSFVTENAMFLCLNPPDGYANGDSNAYSQCFYVEIKNDETFSLLLTGDIEGEGEEIFLQELQSRNIDDVTVLKVPHHGSRNSSGEAFLQQVKPRVAIISCGENNSYGHPHAETLKRLEEAGSAIFTTPECGAITIEIEKEVRVYGFNE